jgi:EAL domain-containing protein (putative c-di-GMP-specific phosphodiesterase class I)
MSVNVSGWQFDREDLAQRIYTIVRESDCKPAWVELEVTESRRLHDLESVKKLRKMGFSIAIDNFGTGNSSLSYLTHFPINTLKIDRSFIDLETETCTHNAAFARAIIAMAHSLVRVVAEGVATGPQFDFLRAEGCDCFQGFWISAALPADAFAEFCRKAPEWLTNYDV